MDAKVEGYNNTLVVVEEVAKNRTILIDVTEPVSIRSVKLGDLEQVLSILNEQLEEAYTEGVKREIVDAQVGEAECFVAEIGSEVLGYVCWRKRISAAYVETIAVKEGCQGKGIGSRLLRVVIESVKQKNPEVKILNAITDTDAKDAVPFFIKNGFVASGVVNDEFTPGDTQIHLCLKLE